MNYIIDTSIFLWYISGDSSLTKKHIEIIQNKQNTIYLSVASIWEATVKQTIGKLNLPHKAAFYLPEQRVKHKILSLPITEDALSELHNLPDIHKDPFDRIIICQALANGYTILTSDGLIKKYSVETI